MIRSKTTMEASLSASIARLLEREKNLPELSQGALMTIAQRLEYSMLEANQSASKEFAGYLHELFAFLMSKAAPDVRRAVRATSNSDASLRQAFSLGQVSLAQALAAQFAEKREVDDFQQKLNDVRYISYVQALAKSDLSGVDLAKQVNACDETVSRKLKDLRELGITDFRREGRLVVNFLTPAARAVMAMCVHPVQPDPMPVKVSNIVRLDERRRSLGPHLKSPMHFSRGACSNELTRSCYGG